MLCLISYIFIFSIISALEADSITLVLAVLWGGYGLLMFYHTSKSFWSEIKKTDKKNRRKK